MTFRHATRVTLCGGLLAAAGLAAPAQGQAETETVRERVVVTLPSGKRIVRMVEKQVPVSRPAAPAASVDPFVVVNGGSAGGEGSSGGSGDRENNAQIDPRILEWIGWYQAGDSRADANRDGRVTAADFNAFLQTINGDAGNDDTKGGGDGNTGGGDGGGDDGNGGGDDGNGGGDDGNAGNNGGGSDGGDAGWTELTPSADSLIFYVSESGSDSNDGLSPQRPLRTVGEGVRRLRDGKPDWLLLRRGDTFSETLGGNWEKSGRSVSEKMVVSAYGEGPRPVLVTGSNKGLNLIKNDRRQHLAFTSLEFRAGVKYRNAGIAMVSGGVQDVLFEDLLISGYTHAMSLQGGSRDIAVRRCLLLDSGGMTHAQGLYASGIDGLLIEQSVIDRNGWRPDQGRDASATIFAHNVYVQTSVKNLVFRDNFSSRASSHGLQARNGGVVDGNVFWQNPIAVMYGNEGRHSHELPVSGSIDDNVVIEGINMASDSARGWGIQIQHANDVSIARNIVANSLVDGGGYGLMLFTSNPADNRDLLVEGNIVDDFGRAIRVDEDDVISTIIRGNTFTTTSGDLPLLVHRDNGTAPGLVYEGNRYLHTSLQREFELDGARIDLPEWQADFDPMGGSVLTSGGSSDPYVNGSATLEDYARSIGFGGSDAFINAMRQQRKGNWDERLTPAAIRQFFRDSFTLRGAG